MDKCYDGVYQKNVDTLRPKIDFLNRMNSNFCKTIGHLHPKLAEATKNLFELYNIVLDNVDK